MDIERERIALTPFLHEAVDSAQLAARVQERDVRFVIDVQPQELSVTADPARIHQVIANLLDNASRHSPSGGTIYVRAWEFTNTGSIAIEVRDQGPGIAEADREAVFERFERGGTPDQSGGTGLGLAIARWAVELHGGTIEVIDHPGRDSADPSSTIRVLLPNTPQRDEHALG